MRMKKSMKWNTVCEYPRYQQNHNHSYHKQQEHLLIRLMNMKDPTGVLRIPAYISHFEVSLNSRRRFCCGNMICVVIEWRIKICKFIVLSWEKLDRMICTTNSHDIGFIRIIMNCIEWSICFRSITEDWLLYWYIKKLWMNTWFLEYSNCSMIMNTSK